MKSLALEDRFEGLDAREAAKKFIEFAIVYAEEPGVTKGDYLSRMTNILSRISSLDGFHEHYTKQIKSIPSRRIPQKARLFLYSIE